jgi:hypothetical protein
VIRQVVIVSKSAEAVRELEHPLSGRAAVIVAGEEAGPAIRQTDTCKGRAHLSHMASLIIMLKYFYLLGVPWAAGPISMRAR